MQGWHEMECTYAWRLIRKYPADTKYKYSIIKSEQKLIVFVEQLEKEDEVLYEYVDCLIA